MTFSALITGALIAKRHAANSRDQTDASKNATIHNSLRMTLLPDVRKTRLFFPCLTRAFNSIRRCLGLSRPPSSPVSAPASTPTPEVLTENRSTIAQNPADHFSDEDCWKFTQLQRTICNAVVGKYIEESTAKGTEHPNNLVKFFLGRAVDILDDFYSNLPPGGCSGIHLYGAYCDAMTSAVKSAVDRFPSTGVPSSEPRAVNPTLSKICEAIDTRLGEQTDSRMSERFLPKAQQPARYLSPAYLFREQ